MGTLSSTKKELFEREKNNPKYMNIFVGNLGFDPHTRGL